MHNAKRMFPLFRAILKSYIYIYMLTAEINAKMKVSQILSAESGTRTVIVLWDIQYSSFKEVN